MFWWDPGFECSPGTGTRQKLGTGGGIYVCVYVGNGENRHDLACVAGAKRGGGGGGAREKGKREGSACSKSLCFCITPTNFLVIRLCLLSIKCRYTRHCRKTLYSRTKEIRLVIQIQKTLWRKLEPLFCRNKKSFTLQKRSKKLRLHQKANPADQKTITTVNRYVCHDLSVWNMRLK